MFRAVEHLSDNESPITKHCHETKHNTDTELIRFQIHLTKSPTKTSGLNTMNIFGCVDLAH